MRRAVTVPHGAVANGRALRRAELRTLTGADEAWVLEESVLRSRSELISGLLARCVVSVEQGLDPTRAVRAFTAGDREALLLALYATAFGDQVGGLLDCPSCEERLDLDLSVPELLLDPYAAPRERYDATLRADGSNLRFRFRLPTGADQEAVAREPDVDAGVRILLERCLEAPARRIGDELLAALSAEIERRDPQAQISLSLRCPACDEPVTAILDAATILLGNLAVSTRELFEEVHSIALHYHWSEREILALDVSKRRRYLELIAGVDAGSP